MTQAFCMKLKLEFNNHTHGFFSPRQSIISKSVAYAKMDLAKKRSFLDNSSLSPAESIFSYSEVC